MAKRVGRWLGGYIRSTSDGRKVYVIERWGGGSRWHIATGCSTERAALKELERFEANPSAYRPRGADGEQLRMTSELVLGYRDHQLRAGVTEEWADEVARCLVEWMRALGTRDIRSLDLHRDIKPALANWTARVPHRIKALKGFFRWLRVERGLVSRQQDATIDLLVPQAKPEKHRRKKVVPPEDVQAVLKHLKQPTRDVLHLLTATAMHLSEIRRLVESGEIVEPMNGEGVLAVLITRHKSGDLTKTPLIYPEHVEAARRLKARGCLPKRMTLARHMKSACETAGVPKFGLGQMRHSVLTWGVEKGASLEQAADFAHHRSKATTAKFYVDLAVPKAPIPILRLVKS
jgi:integrase